MLLIVQAGDVRDAAVVGVVLQSSGKLLGEVPADFDSRREVESEA